MKRKTLDSRILTINTGSSSIKFALFNAADSLTRILEGTITRIGLPNACFQMKGVDPADNFSRIVAAPNHTAANNLLIDWFEKHIGLDAKVTVGHRIVQGGLKYSEPQLITPKMIAALRELSSLDPGHVPEEIRSIEALYRRFPALSQIACFDTAFHHDMPRVAQMLAIPRRFEAQGVRRYGFHGLSYSFLMEELSRVAGPEAVKGRVILAHLGSGASLAAVRDGKSLDTSMGFTPAGGIPMSTRSGDLDPSLVWHLAQTEKMTAKKFNEMVNFQSGLLGISGITSDMHDLINCENKNKYAAEAVALFCYQVKKYIGSYAAALGGVDTLIFSGGIGENSAIIRQRVCAGLEFLGIELEKKQNVFNSTLISPKKNRVAVRVIHTDEALAIAELVCHVLHYQ